MPVIVSRRIIGRYLGLLIVTGLIIVFFQHDEDSNTKEYRKYREKLRLGRTRVPNKYILLWTPFFDSKTWYLGKEFLDKTVSKFFLISNTLEA
jgi:hypothetical protein